MKFLYLVLLLSTLLAACSKSDDGSLTTNPNQLLDTLAPGWSRTRVGGTNYDIFFTNNAHGYLCSDSTVYVSNDGGINFSNPTPMGFSIFNMAATGNSAMFVNQFSNTAMRTSNGGSSFLPVVLDPTGGPVNDIFFSSADVCYAAGGGRVYKSVDGGASFILLKRLGGGVGTPMSAIYFTDNLNGWVTSRDSIHHTNDGGITWQGVPKQGVNIPVVFALSPQTAFYSSAGMLYKTVDGGFTWQMMFQEVGYAGVIDIHFVDANTGYINAEKRIYKTVDGGINWQPVVQLGSGGIIEIHFTDANHGWACGNDGTVLKYQQ